MLDDQALIPNVRGKGLVVLTGCGHAGIVNITGYARRLTGTGQVYAVMGGFHLGGPLFEPLIPRVCAAVPPQRPQFPQRTGVATTARRRLREQSLVIPVRDLRPAAGSYQYLCPVSGHAREGMAGAFTVR